MHLRIFLVAFVLLAAFAHAARAQSCPLPAPTLKAPADGATGVDPLVTFEWNAVANVIEYEVWASYDGGEFVQLGATSAADFTAEIPPNTFVEWYVVARHASCDAKSVQAFFTTLGCAAEAVTLLEPLNGAEVGSPVDFSWTEVPDAAAYRLWLVIEDDQGELEYFIIDETTLTSSTARISPGIYGWFVETVLEDCDSAFSEAFFFQVPRSANCSEASATLVSPPDGATDVISPVTFQWNPVPGAIGYEVWAAYEDGALEYIDETTGTAVEAWLGDGTFSWVVVTQFNGCDDTVSDPFTFTITYNPECDRGIPYPISPADGATDVPRRIDFIWTPVDAATIYNVWIVVNDSEAAIVGSTTGTRLTATVPEGDIYWAVEVEFADCPPDLSPSTFFQVSSSAICREPDAPEIYLDPEAVAGDTYLLIWSPGLNTSSYEVQESTTETFDNATTTTLTDILLFLSKEVTEPTRFYYRVRSLSSCGLGLGPYSEAAVILIAPNVPLSAADADMVTSYGEQRVVVQQVRLPGSSSGPQAFTAATDKPWMRVEPSSFVIPVEGIDLTVTADPRDLSTGGNTATIILTPVASAVATNATGFTVPVTVNLVTPVSPNAGKAPLPTSLIIPAVGHAIGASATFESDVRLTNASAKVMKYLLNFTPTASDGTKIGHQASIQVEPGETAALNDLLKNFFGFAGPTDNVQGVLEIRPLDAASSNSSSLLSSPVTFASSRTYANTATGTFGQYIPAIPFSRFIGKDKVLSLQQVAQSTKYRTNLGLVEASGEPASVVVSVYGDSGAKLGDYPISLRPGEHMQLGRFLESKGLTVNDGRIEVKVTSGTGKVTAYASVLDNATSDPLLVLPVEASAVTASRYVIPGVAAINTGAANWRSDVRLYNAGTSAVNARLEFFSQGGGPAIEKTITIEAGTVAALDDILPSLFNVPSGGGSLLVSTTGSSKLVTTARTYNLTSSGTYGQFVPGITPQEGVGLNERALQILQVEQSERFRTNVGLVELTGNAVTVEISAFKPDSKVSVSTQVNLAANQFMQIGNLLSNLGFPTTYNARVTLKVVAGSGRIGGYASLIDNRTQDPTYVPAQ